MSQTLRIDRIEGASYTNGILGKQAIRIAYVEGILANSLAPDPFVLIRALATAGLPQLGESHPSSSQLTVTQHRVYPLSDTQARIEILYETSLGPLNYGVFVLTDSTTLTQATTQLVPGTWEPIQVLPLTGNGDAQTVSVSYPQIMRQLRILTVVDVGQLPSGNVGFTRPGVAGGGANSLSNISNALGCVNDRTYLGLKAGYWLLSGFQSTTNDLGQHYSLEILLSSKLSEDWSEAAVYRNTITGKYLPPAKTITSALRSQSYTFGIQQRKGITKVGLCPPINMKAVLLGLG